MKNASISVSELKVKTAGFFQRFHTLLFFLLVSTGLFIAIFMLLSVIRLSSTSVAGEGENLSSDFDQATIERVKNLGNKTPGSALGRENPFIE